MIPIYGLQKTTLLDYKGYLASTIFLGHCNYRCPFCQNSLLIGEKITEPVLLESDILTHLKKRKGILEGICITGGEPTLYNKLPEFIEKIKSLGYLVKLDTNGTNPDMVKSLVENGLIDYVAMDIKNARNDYSISCGIKDPFLDQIDKTISFLMDGKVPYEFRTTLVKEEHTMIRIKHIGEWLHGSSTYILQNFKDSDQVKTKGLHGFTDEELQDIKQMLLSDLPNTHIRGEVY